MFKTFKSKWVFVSIVALFAVPILISGVQAEQPYMDIHMGSEGYLMLSIPYQTITGEDAMHMRYGIDNMYGDGDGYVSDDEAIRYWFAVESSSSEYESGGEGTTVDYITIDDIEGIVSHGGYTLRGAEGPCASTAPITVYYSCGVDYNVSKKDAYTIEVNGSVVSGIDFSVPIGWIIKDVKGLDIEQRGESSVTGTPSSDAVIIKIEKKTFPWLYVIVAVIVCTAVVGSVGVIYQIRKKRMKKLQTGQLPVGRTQPLQPPTQQQYPLTPFVQPYQQPPVQPAGELPTIQPVYPCSSCGQPLRFIQQYQKWYCDKCKKYV